MVKETKGLGIRRKGKGQTYERGLLIKVWKHRGKKDQNLKRKRRIKRS